jgi:hypothetical protein
MGKLTVFKVLRISVPVLRQAIPRIIAATRPLSEGGQRISPDELEDLAADIGLQLGEALLRELRRRADVIDS